MQPTREAPGLLGYRGPVPTSDGQDNADSAPAISIAAWAQGALENLTLSLEELAQCEFTDKKPPEIEDYVWDPRAVP